PPLIGSQLPELQARMAVSVTPLPGDVGQVMILLDQSQAAALDAFTGIQLVKSADFITTSIPSDPQAAGKGVVAGSDVLPVVPPIENTNTPMP
ncbi:MAG: hypothetical protein V1916_02905, partial [Patescibacteria group bacterium]